MAEIVLVAGASGHLGSQIVLSLRARGLRVRAAGRDAARLRRFAGLSGVETWVADLTDPAAADRAMQGVAMVVSAVGASISVQKQGDARGLAHSDLRANRNLIQSAVRAKVLQFLYVSVLHDGSMESLEYVRVHKQIESELQASPLGAVIVQPTGFYYALAEMQGLAARTRMLPRIGNGLARTNPIDERELAQFCVDALLRGPGSYPVGGPEVLTRAQILHTLLESVGQRPRLVPVPARLMHWVARVLAWVHPRLGHLLQFFVVVSTHDCVAPAYGKNRFAAYLQNPPSSASTS
jgi:uncharacterized protein YbjT (DUF2867 family)